MTIQEQTENPWADVRREWVREALAQLKRRGITITIDRANYHPVVTGELSEADRAFILDAFQEVIEIMLDNEGSIWRH